MAAPLGLNRLRPRLKGPGGCQWPSSRCLLCNITLLSGLNESLISFFYMPEVTRDFLNEGHSINSAPGQQNKKQFPNEFLLRVDQHLTEPVCDFKEEDCRPP